MNYSKYTRSFIILDDKKSNFRNTNEKIKGHIKIELRNNQGSLRCIVQNLKYYDDARYLYRLYFFGKKGGKTIFSNAGTLYIDKQGKGEHFFKFNPLNLDGEENELADFSIIAVVAQPNKDIIDDDNIYPILTGYLIKDINKSPDENSIMNINKKDNIENKEPIEEEIAQEDETSKESTPNEQTTKQTKESVQAASVSESKKEEKPAEKSEANDYLKPPYKDFSQYEAPPMSQHLTKKSHDTSSYYANYIKSVSQNLEKVLSFNNKSEPFEKDAIGCDWWKIMNLMSIPFANTSYLQRYPEYIQPYYNPAGFDPRGFYPSCHDLIYKYQHYIFGIEKDEKGVTQYYYYGIPGRYMKEEQPDNGTSGFQYWQPLQGSEKRKGDYGYWIVAINAKTGQLEIPVEES